MKKAELSIITTEKDDGQITIYGDEIDLVVAWNTLTDQLAKALSDGKRSSINAVKYGLAVSMLSDVDHAEVVFKPRR